jgi:hypothetical protein
MHVPDLDDGEEPPAEPPTPLKAETAPPLPPKQQSKWLIRVGVEVILITMGVFLALMGEHWRQNAQDRGLAEDSLRRLRSEIQANREAVAAVKDYHPVSLKRIRAFLAADDKARAAMSVNLEGIRPAFFESTAWDLALATQSLVHMDPEVAFAVSRIYGLQRRYDGLTEGITHAMYLRPPSEGPEAFFPAVAVFDSDIVFFEPELLRLYDEVIPQIDRALGE